MADIVLQVPYYIYITVTGYPPTVVTDTTTKELVSVIPEDLEDGEKIVATTKNLSLTRTSRAFINGKKQRFTKIFPDALEFIVDTSGLGDYTDIKVEVQSSDFTDKPFWMWQEHPTGWNPPETDYVLINGFCGERDIGAQVAFIAEPAVIDYRDGDGEGYYDLTSSLTAYLTSVGVAGSIGGFSPATIPQTIVIVFELTGIQAGGARVPLLKTSGGIVASGATVFYDDDSYYVQVGCNASDGAPWGGSSYRGFQFTFASITGYTHQNDQWVAMVVDIESLTAATISINGGTPTAATTLTGTGVTYAQGDQVAWIGRGASNLGVLYSHETMNVASVSVYEGAITAAQVAKLSANPYLHFNGGGVWYTRNPLPQVTYSLAAVGVPNDSLLMGGADSFGDTRTSSLLHDGSTFTTVSALSTSVANHAAGGTSTAAVYWGGYSETGASQVITAATYDFNGSTYSSGDAYPTNIRGHGGDGTATNAKSVGGSTTAPGATPTSASSSYDGTVWSTEPALSGTTYYTMGCGDNSSFMMRHSGEISTANKVEIWDGTSWVAGPDGLSTVRRGMSGSGGTGTFTNECMVNGALGTGSSYPGGFHPAEIYTEGVWYFGAYNIDAEAVVDGFTTFQSVVGTGAESAMQFGGIKSVATAAVWEFITNV